jgi:hypothetical protein
VPTSGFFAREFEFQFQQNKIERVEIESIPNEMVLLKDCRLHGDILASCDVYQGIKTHKRPLVAQGAFDKPRR